MSQFGTRSRGGAKAGCLAAMSSFPPPLWGRARVGGLARSATTMSVLTAQAPPNPASATARLAPRQTFASLPHQGGGKRSTP